MSIRVGMMQMRPMQPTALAMNIGVQVQAGGLRGQQASEHKYQNVGGGSAHAGTIHD